MSEIYLFNDLDPAFRPPDAPHRPDGSRYYNPPHFDGDTFSEKEDGERLRSQLRQVREAMSNGEWWTLAALAAKCHGSEAGVSARIRDLRKSKHGGYRIERRRVAGGRGLHEYRQVGE